MTTNGRPRTTVMDKITRALARGRGVTLPLRDVQAIVDIIHPINTSQYDQLKDLVQDWQRQAILASSWNQAAVYVDVAHTLKHWIETQQGAGE